MSSTRRITIRLDDEMEQYLEEMKEYYTLGSDSQVFRKSLLEAYRIMKKRKARDAEIFGNEGDTVVFEGEDGLGTITAKGMSEEQINRLREVIEKADKKYLKHKEE